jgi:hypothetical protein
MKYTQIAFDRMAFLSHNIHIILGGSIASLFF